MNIPLLLIILILLTIIAINYTLNNVRQNTGVYFNDDSKIIKYELCGRRRVFDMFSIDVFDSINSFFNYNINSWDKGEWGLEKSFDKMLVDGFCNYTFYIGLPNIINANRLIIFPLNDNSKWCDSFYLKCTKSGNIYYPEPNSVMIHDSDLIVIDSVGGEKLVLSD